MKRKIMKIMLLVSSLLLILFGIITLHMFTRVKKILLNNAEKSGKQVEEYSDLAMRDQVMERLSATTIGCAYVVNETLENFAGTISIIADSATDIYTNPDRYGGAKVDIPKVSDIGISMGQFVYAEDVDPDDESIRKELSMIGTLQGNLLAMYSQYPELGASYIGTETGIMLLAGPVLTERWDENGNYSYMDPRKRPWYEAAKEAGTVKFSGIKEDYDTGKPAIMCGAPVYKGDKMVAVAGAGVYLEGIENLMMNARISDEGNSCIIDETGRIIFSSQDQGELKTDTMLGEQGSNSLLADLARKAKNGENGIELLEVDGESCYMAFYPIDIVGWSLISVIPEKVVIEPTLELLNSLDESRKEELSAVQSVIGSALVTIAAFIVSIGIVVIVVIGVASKRLVEPIELLTKKVEKLEGDQLEFEWNINTRDEVQKLASSFGTMTDRMKKYITDIQAVTAEKERIGVELGLATRIQAGMLPSEFPPFPDRNEFDIYAAMDPAREVGGDFYDFFLIDEDHLGLVIADVSGKGIPAALYMMIAKVILQSCAMLGKSAAEVLQKTNDALTSKNTMDMFVTVWFGILEISSGKLTCANAGHEYPAIKRANGEFELYKDKHGFVIGGMEGVRYKEYLLELEHGDKLFLYTDGVPEATDKDNKMYGTERMIVALNKAAGESPQQILKLVRDDINKFVGDAEQFDDLTMMCIEYK
ncbi:SpoIIE family protein phosphatase [Butyrivibrio sp. YAB3001]|uniref:SpoIIE family protein phosphatase n=1 Tax=Butyrivibrio sp. YAB3001 TaxID=1520812 RepID=UPI0008F65BF3|nr:SpoIIE family protein phosphatase [Butyrivibrio sp. YAB3001]SFD05371.1 sigma-B regulation protein RsbU (phosphoserine phosphatase) [Butyrivibrio sp. YAB3001]